MLMTPNCSCIKPGDTNTAVTTLKLMFADGITQWMAANRLTLNSDKTEVL